MSGKNADDLARQENLEEFLSGMQTFVLDARKRDEWMKPILPIICRT